MRRLASVFIVTLVLVAAALVLPAFVDHPASRFARASAASLDPTAYTPLATTTEEYKFPAVKDPLVEPTVFTELWARVYRPASLLKGQMYPLLVFLHGNHSTCGRYAGAGPGRLDVSSLYTTTGTCPDGYVPVPSHQGYAYVAEKLAGAGYIVVSINANRGVNAARGVTGDRGLNLRRGRLVLRHLMLLGQWNAGDRNAPDHPLKATLKGHLDFQHVGLFGHSRGGEGVRAAYNFYRDAGSPWPSLVGPVKFEGIFEIGPVDGQTGRILNADGTAWTVLLPMCDGDVYNLQGVKVFDRMLANGVDDPATFKATYTVWGANHNFFNTEWQVSDSAGCLGHRRLFDHLLGSPTQRQTAIYAVLAFFRGNVGVAADHSLNQLFDPQYDLPTGLTDITRVDRGYIDSPNAVVTATFDDFSTGFDHNIASGVAVTYGPALIANHDPTQRVARVSWNGAGPGTFFQSGAKNVAVNLAGYQTIDFRVARQCKDNACTQSSMGFPFDSDFSIRLVDGRGNLSAPVRLSNYINLTGPVGGLVMWAGTSYHPILQTVRIPLGDFGSIATLGGVRFVFDQTTRDDIFLADITLSTVGSVERPAVFPTLALDDSLLAQDPINDVNRVKSVKKVAPSPASGGQDAVEIELTSNRGFQPQGELLILKIGDQAFGVSGYPDNGDIATIVFTLTAQEFAQFAGGEAMRVQYGTGPGGASWNFGHLDKSALR